MRIVYIFLLLFSFQACTTGNDNDAIPADIIPKEKMETILWQLIQSDELINGVAIKDSTRKTTPDRIKIYQQVFDLNKTSKSAFKKSYQYYLSRPDITKIMFDSITTRATRERGDAYKPKAIKPVTK